MSRKVEEWRDIPGYNGFYQVSDWGRLRSFRDQHHKGGRLKTPTILKPTKYEYRTYVVIKWEGKQRTLQVGQAVALTFLGNIPEGYVAYHKDGNFENNALTNIGIGPRRELSRERMRRKVAGWNRKPVLKINRGLEVIEAYPSARRAAQANGYRNDEIWHFCNLAIAFSVFAPDDFIYAWDDDNWLRKTLQRAKAELDDLGIRYNDPCTECYYDLQQEPDVDLSGVDWAEAPMLQTGGDVMKGL